MTALLTLANRLGIDPGPLNQSDLQEKVCSEAQAQIETLTRERDEALAHAERLRGAFEYALKDGLTEQAIKMILAETPPAALAAMKAEWQAEAVMAFSRLQGLNEVAGVSPYTAQDYAQAVIKRAQEAGDA